jgi:pSer/pThr/pTyr-binding forkhead associated (FHA) protein
LIIAKNDNEKTIRIKFIQGPFENKEWYFNPDDTKIIRIGRSIENEIVFKDESVSRLQCR